MTKQEARTAARAAWRRLDADSLRVLGEKMTEELLAQPAWQQADAVFCFVPMPTEPDLTPVLAAALRAGKPLYVPRVVDRAGRMLAVRIASLESLAPAPPYGLLEPPGDAPGVGPEFFGPRALAVIPCLACSQSGVRLGRGGGYYDRFLAHYKGKRLLVCPDALRLEGIPADPWDARFAPGEFLTGGC